MVVLDFMEVSDDHKEGGVRLLFLSAFEYI